MTLPDILAAVARQTGLPLQLGEHDSCALDYDSGLEVILASVDRGQSVLLYQPLRRVTAADEADLLRRCMVLNAYGAQTNGYALGLDPESGWIVLSRRMPVAETDATRLTAWIAGFMTTAIATIAALSEPTADVPGDTTLVRDAIRV